MPISPTPTTGLFHAVLPLLGASTAFVALLGVMLANQVPMMLMM